jgi:hypothetical protein
LYVKIIMDDRKGIRESVPGSPEGEKQGWPVKGFRPAWAGAVLGGYSGVQGGGPERKNREAGGRMTLTRLFLPFGRLQKEGPRRPETKKNKK